VHRDSEFTPQSVSAAVAAAAGMFTSIAPIIVSTFSVFLGTFIHDYGWGRGSVSFAITISAIVGGLVTPFAGRAIDRFGVRRVMLPAVALFGVTVMSLALAKGVLWQIYLGFAAVGVLGGFHNMVPYFKVASLWFHRQRGVVLSLVSACYGLAGALMPKLVQPLVARYGWHSGYLFLGAVVLVSLLVLVPLLRVPRGSEGLRPSAADDTAPAAAVLPGVSAREARATGTFWLLFTLLFLAVMSLVGTLTQIFPMMVDRGIAPASATTVLSAFYLGSTTGQLTYGWFVDRVDTPRVAVPFFACALAGATVLYHTSNLSLLLPAAYLTGIGHGSELGLVVYFTGRYFGVRNLGAIYGLIYAGATLASGLGPLAFGLSYDWAGSYGPMMIGFQGALLLAICGLFMLKPYVFAARTRP